MVRRGSAVRVRQWALQKRRKAALLVRLNLQNREYAVGMERFIEPSGSERAFETAENDRIQRSRTGGVAAPRADRRCVARRGHSRRLSELTPWLSPPTGTIDAR
jgi:hypothetical protein